MQRLSRGLLFCLIVLGLTVGCGGPGTGNDPAKVGTSSPKSDAAPPKVSPPPP